MKLTKVRHRDVIDVIEDAPAGDILNAVVGIETALGIGMEATAEDFLLWEADARAAGYTDEFSPSEAELAAMTAEWKVAWLARLLRTIALDFGVGTEFSGEIGTRREDADSLAPLLRRFCEIASQHQGGDALGAAGRTLNDLLHQLPQTPERRHGWYLKKAEIQAEAIIAAVRRRSDARFRGAG